MHAALPAGLWPVMITPFNADGSLDDGALQHLVDWYIAHGAAGLFAVCLSSECHFLTAPERVQLASRVVHHAQGRVPVVAGALRDGDGPLSEAVRAMAGTGVAASVILTNELVPREESDNACHAAVAELIATSGECALGFYECPAPWKRLLSLDTVKLCAASGQVRYLKETSCDRAVLASKVAAAANSPLFVANACMALGLASLQAGAPGLSAVAANVAPQLLSWLCAHYDTQPERATAVHAACTVIEELIKRAYPASAKTLATHYGARMGVTCRKPGCELGDQHQVITPLVTEHIDAALALIA
ncbi:MAG: dihydrodipicolinate synthase family protein [Planctomycetota bacterium]|jgi:4-hydroxy-tetrahydrodipicolinate synthase|nr:dihydrodipicolinate synthase family protein [Planctomycetota bacterium]